ncbi:ABC transporter ATP-binding protein [Mesohalobacter halotolerans]|uniref:ABC transporter ATP-binding protein n=1 Tax=Mesohalobacter halotolerans TaxID=1883405 RepID=A0A4U5TQ00_9FLAO|nr:ABC transporter ATP-binding protein [Mesohalobacter halotolerans]TKS56237.1 ABC transporter ATP-binding protein [Mesohalobacter halotolerans]
MSKTKTGKAFDIGLFRRVLAFTNPYKKTFYFVLFSAIALAGLSMLRPHFLGLIVDNALPEGNKTLLIELIIWMLIVLMGEVVFQLSFIYFANWLGQEVIRDIRVKLFEHMINFKKQYFDTSAVGRLVTRAVSDIETIASIFSQGLFMILSDLLKMLAVLLFMFYKSWQLTLLILTVLPFVFVATRIFQRKMKIAFEEVRTQVSNLNSFVQERLTGMKIVHIFNRERKEYEKFKDINDKHKIAWNKTVLYNSIFFPIAEMSISVTIGLLVWFGGLRVVESDTLSLGIIVAFIEYVRMLFAPLRQIADKFNSLQMGMVAANRVFGILDTEAYIDNSGTIQAQNLKGKITFDHVRFSYVKDEEVLKGISLQVQPGETIAIVGATGAGKSTVINLLTRFYDINSGQILIDDRNIKDYELKSLRQSIAVVLQDVFLFAESILYNITLHDDNITKEDVIQAAKSIGVHDFIMSLPNGYDYNVKERGAMLSSGQRQLIAFLRAYVCKPSILILDEATSSIDSYSEQLIQNATDKITKDRTSIIIAHRLATVKNADKIIVMDQGQIIEIGTHDNLLKNPDGYYTKLYQAQFESEEVNIEG